MKEEKAKILIVDDEAGIREHLSEALQEAGYKIKTAEDGEKALKVIDTFPLDMALVDIRIPEKNGLEVLRQIRIKRPEAMTIMITGHASLETAVEALRRGAYDYLTKPFDMEKLLSVLRRGIREQRLVRENFQLSEELQHTYVEVISSLATAIDAKNHRTQHHSQEVTKYVLLIADKLKFTPEERETLKRAASLHDLGKIGIPDNILTKSGSLTEEEWAQIEKHPVWGSEILSSLEFLKEVADLIYHHHEKYEGTGYPAKLKGKKIALGARIIAVADAFEAMISERPYRRALSQEEALTEIESGLGSQFDPDIGKLFISIIQDNGIFSQD